MSLNIHPIYRATFLYLEPVTALSGFLAAYFTPALYLSLTSHTEPRSTFTLLRALLSSTTPDSSSNPLSPATYSNPLSLAPPEHATHAALQQLANLYLLFAVNEAFVLRAAYTHCAGPAALAVWRTLLAGLLLADLGHLWSVRAYGPGVYLDVLRWNAIDFGNVGIVYIGMALRVAFLLGIGVKVQHGKRKVR